MSNKTLYKKVSEGEESSTSIEDILFNMENGC